MENGTAVEMGRVRMPEGCPRALLEATHYDGAQIKKRAPVFIVCGICSDIS